MSAPRAAARKRQALYIEARKAPGATDQEGQAANPTERTDLFDGERVLARQAAHAPGVGHERRRDAETNDIGERVELHTEFGGGTGHAGDTAVEGIEQNGKAD